jgi:hypothetical protein
MSSAEHVLDLHGYYPYEADTHAAIVGALQAAYEAGADTLRIIHGHGHNRFHASAVFANTNTGELGLAVRGRLRNDHTLRQWMLAKIDVSHNGSTVVRIRRMAR